MTPETRIDGGRRPEAALARHEQMATASHLEAKRAHQGAEVDLTQPGAVRFCRPALMTQRLG
ncbi:MAG: hypothetical protein Q4D96_14750 [Propionibacteriaceae bacterium]|nr:hypothetical protein [Propionibacteriaceae bacterium]